MNNAVFNKCGIYAWLMLETKGFSSESSISFSNIIFKSAYTALEMIDMSEVFVTVVLANVSVKNSKEHGCNFFSSDILIQDSFNYEMNNGSIILAQSSLTFDCKSSVKIFYNFDIYTAALYTEDSCIHVSDDSIIIFGNNRGGYGGAICLQQSEIHLYGNISMTFSGNEGNKGGAIALLQESSMNFRDGNASLLFINNYANIVGGAIFVDTKYYQQFNYVRDIQSHLFHQVCLYPDNFLSIAADTYPNFHFRDNTAAIAGSAIYGIWNLMDIQYFHFDDYISEYDLSVVSSDPVRICTCLHSKSDCNIRNKTIQVFPGQVFEIEAVAVGELNGIVPTYANGRFVQPSTGELQSNEYIQSVRKFCSKLSYTVKSSQETETLQLTPSQTMISTCLKEDFISYSFHLTFNFKLCPIGFGYNKTSKQCQIPNNLIKHGIECDLRKMQVLRFSPKWINATLVHVPNDQDSGVIIHDHCPFDYCFTIKGVQPLDLDFSDQQCAYNRSRILCGACQRGFSHVLGTSKCLKCTKPWTALTIALIAIAGLILVVALLFLNITVSVGTINGLIFYANIVRANYAIFFPHQISKSFLSMFIAWLNLDLGIEICFYNGLNAYSKTWLQFMFPLYIWFMVITIIVASHYSSRVSRVCGNNSVQVLATLFLLSYAKLFRIIITIFLSTPIVYPDGYRMIVWLYDGNVEYLKGKHIPLFIAALFILIVLSIPFTLSLLCIQWLQRLSHLKLLNWVGKIQPLFDAYTGPYNLKHRYWTGLLLLLRVCLYIAFSCNVLGDPKINLIVIIVVISNLLFYCTMVGGVYKSWALNLLNYSFLLNLTILSAMSLYLLSTDIGIELIIYASTGIAFVLFIAIIIYHLIVKIMNSKTVQKIIRFKKKVKEEIDMNADNQPNGVIENNTVTSTTIELGEPLLADNQCQD